MTLELLNGVVLIENTLKTPFDFTQETDLTQFVYQAYQMSQINNLRRQPRQGL